MTIAMACEWIWQNIKWNFYEKLKWTFYDILYMDNGKKYDDMTYMFDIKWNDKWKWMQKRLINNMKWNDIKNWHFEKGHLDIMTILMNEMDTRQILNIKWHYDIYEMKIKYKKWQYELKYDILNEWHYK